MSTDNTTTTRGPGARRLTPEALAEVYAIGGYRAIIDAADGHAAAPMLRALAHIGGLAHAAAGYPRHLLSPLRDVLAAVDRLPDAGALAAWALGELPPGSIEPRPDGEVERLRARAEAAEADLSTLAATVGAAVVASALAPGESLSAAPQHIIVSTVNRLRARAEKAEAEVTRVAAERDASRAHLAECHKQMDELEDVLSDVTAARNRAEAEAAGLRAAIGEALRLADIYAGVAAHNAEAEPETAGEAWRSPYMTTMQELRRALGGAR